MTLHPQDPELRVSQDGRSFADLLSQVLNQFSRLFRTEIALAKAEMSVKAKEAAMGVGFIAGGAIIALAALVVLMLALANLFVELGLRPSLAHLLTALIGFGICGLLAWLGLKRLSPDNLTPDRTLNQLNQDVVAAKEQVQ